MISLAITFAVYSAPIFIYRFAIRGEPVPKKSAIKITIIYAIVGIFIMTLIKQSTSGTAVTGGGVILWSFINFLVLSNTNDDNDETEDAGSSEQTTNNEELVNQEGISAPQIIEEPVPLNEGQRHPVLKAQMDNQNTPGNQEVPLTKIDYYPMAFVTDPTDNSIHYVPVRRCHTCGVKLNEGAEFCHKCGTKVD